MFFCKSYSFFQQTTEKTKRRQEDAEDKCQSRRRPACQETAGRAQDQQISQPAQQHSQQHEQPQAAPAGDAAQEEKQHRRQEGIGKVKEDLQPFQPEAAQEGRQELIEKAQGGAAGEAQQRLKALLAGINAHQPSSFPKKPRRCSRSSA